LFKNTYKYVFYVPIRRGCSPLFVWAGVPISVSGYVLGITSGRGREKRVELMRTDIGHGVTANRVRKPTRLVCELVTSAMRKAAWGLRGWSLLFRVVQRSTQISAILGILHLLLFVNIRPGNCQRHCQDRFELQLDSHHRITALCNGIGPRSDRLPCADLRVLRQPPRLYRA
jgi:hypothetical protein